MVYLYCQFSLSYRDIEEILKIRGLDTIDHATLKRWWLPFRQFCTLSLESEKSEWVPDKININKSGSNDGQPIGRL